MTTEQHHLQQWDVSRRRELCVSCEGTRGGGGGATGLPGCLGCGLERRWHDGSEEVHLLRHRRKLKEAGRGGRGALGEGQHG